MTWMSVSTSTAARRSAVRRSTGARFARVVLANEGGGDVCTEAARLLHNFIPTTTSAPVLGRSKGQDKTQATIAPLMRSSRRTACMRPAPSEAERYRRVDAVAALLNEMPMAARDSCCVLHVATKIAMAGRYHNEKDDTGELKPCKDRYSNPATRCNIGRSGSAKPPDGRARTDRRASSRARTSRRRAEGDSMMDFSLLPGSVKKLLPIPGWQYRFDDRGVMFLEPHHSLVLGR